MGSPELLAGGLALGGTVGALLDPRNVGTVAKLSKAGAKYRPGIDKLTKGAAKSFRELTRKAGKSAAVVTGARLSNND